MSSILKALKKLENETSARDDIRSNLLPFQTRVAGRPTPSDPHRKRRLLIISTSLIVLIGIGLTLKFEPWRKQPVPTKTSNLSAEASSIPSTETKPTIKQRPTLNINDSGTNKPFEKTVENPLFAVPKRIKEEPKRFANIETSPNETPDVSEVKSAFSQPITTSPLHHENDQVSETKTDDDPFAAIPVKQTSETLLKLQAIAWSEQPEKCLAVVNGHIVRMGGSVEGTTVKFIGKNEIVFTKEGVTWRQLFK